MRETNVQLKSITFMRAAILLISMTLISACGKSPDAGDTSTLVSSGMVSSGMVSPDKSEQASSINWLDKYEPTSVTMTLKKISDHAYFVQGPPGTPTDNDGFMSNAGVVITKQGVVVFDSLGTPSLAFKLYSLIKEVTDQPVVKVVVSHYHADHIYGLQVFKELGAEIIAPAGAKEYLASDAAEGRLKERRESLFPWVNDDTYIVTPDIYIDSDTSFALGGVNFDIILLGAAHSQGDMMLRVNTDAVLFAADLIFEGRIPFVAGSHFKDWAARLGSLNTETIKIIVPGHGAMSTNPEEAMKFTANYIEFLRKGMGEAVENLVSFDDAYTGLDWSAYKELPAFRVNRINAYYIYLQLEAASMQ